MNSTFPLLMLLAVLLSCQAPTESQQGEPTAFPNLILIIADDMAWNDSRPYGHPHIQTPNLAQMAAEGMRFTQAFLTTSSCSPSRSSIITGRYPHQTDAEQLHWPLPASQTTFVEQLKAAGYWTAQAGKWHLGSEVMDRFDLVLNNPRKGIPTIYSDTTEIPERDGSGCEDWVSLLQSRPTSQPFFLWLAAFDPHRVYKPNTIPTPHEPSDAIIPPYMPETPQVKEDFAEYYDEITRLDSYVGKVLNELQTQGIADNTLVLFISDNGRPFPRDKTTLYDGGIKTPWIVRWPARVPAGSTCDQLVSSVDIATTFLSLAGLEAGETFFGEDFSPLLLGETPTIRPHVYAEDHWHDFDDYTRAVRSKRFKYIRNFYPEFPNTPPADALNGKTYKSMRALRDAGELTEAQMRIFEQPRPEEELYDIVNDPYELDNLAQDEAYADTLAHYRQILSDYRSLTDDRLPPERSPDEFDRETGARTAEGGMNRGSKRERWGEAAMSRPY